MISPLNTFDFLVRAAKLYPERIAVVDGNKRFTYAELKNRSIALNGAVRASGLSQGDVVSVLDYNTHHMLELYYALTKTGIVINPLNFRYSVEELAYMINHVKSKTIFVHQDFLPLFEKMKERLKSVQQVVLIEKSDPVDRKYRFYEELIKEAKTHLVSKPVDENGVAEILFTSGSSDKPKAVGLTHRNLYLNALYTIIAYTMTEDDTLLHVVPLFHANGGGTPQTITAVGGRHVMLRKVDAETMLRLIDHESVTMFVAVPTVLNRFLSHSDFKSFNTSSLRRIIIVGTAASVDLMREIESKIPNCECLSAYGMTEAGPLVALAKPKSEDRGLPAPDRLKLRTRTGYEVLGVQVKLDAGGNNPGPREGEILIKGNSIFNGYYDNHHATSEAIIDGWFRTGDWGREYDGGWIVVIDRAKDMIKSGGENISSTEVEQILTKHPAIAEAAVIPIPNKEWGEVPKAFVVLKPGTNTSETEILDYCRSNMAHFKAPKSIEFLDLLPRTVTGKVTKSDLRRKYWSDRERQIN